MAETYACFQNKTKNDRCTYLTNLYQSYALVDSNGSYLDKDDFHVENFKTRLVETVKDEVNQVSFSIPAFGPALDGNDLWIVSGPITIIVFLVFLAHLEKEVDVLQLAQRYCRSNRDRDLLLSAQVLSAMKSKTKIGRAIRHTVFATCYFIPSALNFLAVEDYVASFSKVVLPLINNPIQAYIELVLACASVFALLYVSWRCYGYGRSIEKIVDDFSGKDFGAAPAVTGFS